MIIPAALRTRFGNLLPAEARVLARMAEDEDVVIGGDLPTEGDDTRKIRAEFVAVLARGGCEGAAPPPSGLHIQGAWIAGLLDLRGPQIDLDLGLLDCRFDAPPLLLSARLANLSLIGSHLPGIDADRLETRGDVFLRGAVVQGEARFPGARLGGNLDCVGARFEREGGFALTADGLETRGSVFLRGAVVQGEARFPGARLGGNFDCDSAYFEQEYGAALNADAIEVEGDVLLTRTEVRGAARLLHARLKHDLICVGSSFRKEYGVALMVRDAWVTGGLILRGETRVCGTLDMTNSRFGYIDVEAASWPSVGELMLDRCCYDAFISSPVDARSRLDWLALQDEARFGQDFWPQPYEQLAKVFREMGHVADARTVLIRKEKLQRVARRAKMGAAPRALFWLRDAAFAVTVRYGRAPMLAFVWLAGLALIGFAMFYAAERNGALKPNTGYTLRADEWVACGAALGAPVHDAGTGETLKGRRASGQTRLACFLAQPEGAKYPEFNAFVYSLDTLLPIVDLEMQDYWIPDESAEWPFARAARWYLWVHIALGWGLSLLAVAGFSGLVKSDGTP
ncbi:hypothetical protein SAMN05444336_102283 [Albimonas donghaensis]|uniref:Membrane-associated oxidoreductase n=1 Tax=Albimonas donghaensis TaxID=356660 RepID=A0A1H2W7P3_9RHOB|nr:hypothetical protein [Albimonas donghaensis]SDW76274.1 hypothetical protein SAMN05444336_102283 [Albimonas donghaensis]